MRFDNTLEVSLPPAQAWPVLLDVRRIAACIPGAELTEVVDERTYRGHVAVRFGPVALSLIGQARLDEVDDASLRARIKVQGTDPKGRGGADGAIEFRLEPAGAGTRVLIHSDIRLAGSIAQYGRGSGMIQSVAAQLVTKFGSALKAQIEQPGAAPAPKAISGLTVLGKAAWESITQPADKPPPES